MIEFEDMDVNAEKGSTAHIMALMVKQFPGSWLPYGPEMVIKCAEPGFKLISQSSGRLDYIETIAQWRKKFRKFHLKKVLVISFTHSKIFHGYGIQAPSLYFQNKPQQGMFRKRGHGSLPFSI